MKKFTPHILIHEVELRSKEDCGHIQSFYFLSYRRARKFVDKHAEEFSCFRVGIGGEPLRLW